VAIGGGRRVALGEPGPQSSCVLVAQPLPGHRVEGHDLCLQPSEALLQLLHLGVLKKADEHPAHRPEFTFSHPPKASHLVLSLLGGSGGRLPSVSSFGLRFGCRWWTRGIGRRGGCHTADVPRPDWLTATKRRTTWRTWQDGFWGAGREGEALYYDLPCEAPATACEEPGPWKGLSCCAGSQLAIRGGLDSSVAGWSANVSTSQPLKSHSSSSSGIRSDGSSSVVA
jgi:hypothetical protein